MHPSNRCAWQGCEQRLAAGSNWLTAAIVSIAQSPPVYCAVATGYCHIPAIEVDDIWGALQ
jgi:hypothetical protein